MWMTEGEIRQSYRLAKDQRNQITILAELNAVPTSIIKRILAEGGLITPESLAKKMLTKWTEDKIETLVKLLICGYRHKEIAAIMNTTICAIEQQISKKKLRKRCNDAIHEVSRVS